MPGITIKPKAPLPEGVFVYLTGLQFSSYPTAKGFPVCNLTL